MDLSRRAALRMGSGLGLGGLLVSSGAAKAVPSLIPDAVPNGNPQLAGSSPKWDIVNKFQNDHIDWHHLHKSNIDADLQGMRSLSPSIRLIIQRRRNSERRDTMSRLRESLGLL